MKARLVLYSLLAMTAPALAGETGVRVTLPILAPTPGLDPTTRQGIDETKPSSGMPPTCSLYAEPYCLPWYTQWARPIFWFPVNNFDYGGGNIIYSAVRLNAVSPLLLAWFGGTQLGYAHVTTIGSGEANTPILKLSGYVMNTTRSHVEAQVTFRYHGKNIAKRDVKVVIEQYDGSGWRQIGANAITPCDVDATPSCGNQTIAVEGWADPNSDVRAQLMNTASGNVYMDIYEATLFGAECFPDTSSPDLACFSQ
ncbi:MAG: hypothetical protein JWN44_4612 [Myxococcales bacterium]|nr:hypothetical protein [Myxococcales bacterium]